MGSKAIPKSINRKPALTGLEAKLKLVNGDGNFKTYQDL